MSDTLEPVPLGAPADGPDRAGWFDVLVVGSGPAGAAAAAACAGRSLSVGLVDPRPDRSWHQTFAAWGDEVPPAYRGDLANRWTDVRVVTHAGTRYLGRPYVRFDNDRLRDHLRADLERAGGRCIRGRARTCRLVGTQVEVAVDDRHLTARAVVDASGHRPALLRTPGGPPPPEQSAYGIVGRFTREPAPTGSVLLMDYAREGADPSGDATPTFLYAMDLGDGRWLAEETSLAARPAVPTTDLRTRLEQRLERRGIGVVSVEDVEHVHFPMGGPLPDRRQLVIGYGAAAGFVHPATGYSVARSLAQAPALADALAGAIAAGGDATAVAHAGWAAVWPPVALRQRRLHELGLDALLRMDGAQIQQFFAAFFGGAPAREGDGRRPTWERYVSGTERTADVLAEMGRVFAAVGWPVRQHLLRAAVRHAVGVRRLAR